MFFNYIFTLALIVASSKAAEKPCQCAPDQWEGILSSVDRQFGADHIIGSIENDMYVYYDFTNKRFAMIDLQTGNRAVADYQREEKYVIRGRTCRGVRSREMMKRMCLPDDAEHMGTLTLGVDIPVDVWTFSGQFNISVKTIVHRPTCVPIMEEMYMSGAGHATMTSSMYLNVKQGISDPAVFDIPRCVVVDEHMLKREADQIKKRSPYVSTHSLYGFLKSAPNFIF